LELLFYKDSIRMCLREFILMRTRAFKKRCLWPKTRWIHDSVDRVLAWCVGMG